MSPIPPTLANGFSFHFPEWEKEEKNQKEEDEEQEGRIRRVLSSNDGSLAVEPSKGSFRIGIFQGYCVFAH